MVENFDKRIPVKILKGNSSDKEAENPSEINFYEWCDAALMSDSEELPWCVDLIYKRVGTDVPQMGRNFMLGLNVKF